MFALPPVLTASNWATVERSLESTRAKREWTNREALAVVQALRGVAKRTRSGWPWWYQYAAAAYGWEPGTDALDESAARADADYEEGAAEVLLDEARRMAAELDASGVLDARLDLADVWGDKDGQALIQRALADDGVKATWKVPLPACKGRDGRPAVPRIDPKTGKLTCPGGGVIRIDDPITAILKSLAKVAIPVALILVAVGAFESSRRQRRRRK